MAKEKNQKEEVIENVEQVYEKYYVSDKPHWHLLRVDRVTASSVYMGWNEYTPMNLVNEKGFEGYCNYYHSLRWEDHWCSETVLKDPQPCLEFFFPYPVDIKRLIIHQYNAHSGCHAKEIRIFRYTGDVIDMKKIGSTKEVIKEEKEEKNKTEENKIEKNNKRIEATKDKEKWIYVKSIICKEYTIPNSEFQNTYESRGFLEANHKGAYPKSAVGQIFDIATTHDKDQSSSSSSSLNNNNNNNNINHLDGCTQIRFELVSNYLNGNFKDFRGLAHVTFVGTSQFYVSQLQSIFKRWWETQIHENENEKEEEEEENPANIIPPDIIEIIGEFSFAGFWSLNL